MSYLVADPGRQIGSHVPVWTLGLSGCMVVTIQSMVSFSVFISLSMHASYLSVLSRHGWELCGAGFHSLQQGQSHTVSSHHRK